VDESIAVLGTDKPMITFNKEELLLFEGLIKKYRWVQTQELTGIYNQNHIELVFNGEFFNFS
jgi:hypothetical protein